MRTSSRALMSVVATLSLLWGASLSTAAPERRSPRRAAQATSEPSRSGSRPYRPPSSRGSSDLRMSVDPPNAVFDVRDMKPGHAAVRPLALYNHGVPILYSLEARAAGDPALADAIQAWIKVGVERCDEAGFDASGVLLASSRLNLLRVGDPAAGEQPGDRYLPSGGSDRFCIRTLFDPLVNDTIQGRKVTVSFVFWAESSSASKRRSNRSSQPRG